jgi:hypothetical protein
MFVRGGGRRPAPRDKENPRATFFPALMFFIVAMGNYFSSLKCRGATFTPYMLIWD